MKKVFVFILSLLVAVDLMVTSVLAEENTSADINITIAKTEEKLIEGFTEIGIDMNTAASLTQKVLNGEMLDSCNPIYQNFLPVVEKITDTDYYAEYIYPDGSKKVLQVRSSGIYGGMTVNGDVYYQVNGATVYGSYGFVNLSFTVSYRSATTSATIISMSNPSAGSFYYNNQTVYGTTTNSIASGGIVYAVSGQPYSNGTFYLQLNVPAALGAAYASMTYQGIRNDIETGREID